MQSPLALDKNTIKKYKITPDMEPTPRQKLAFLSEQMEQIKAMQWRARVDMIHATRLSESDNETLKNKGFSNLGTHANEVEQATGAILMTQKFIDELREEYPELKA